MTIDSAQMILAEIKPARRVRDRYRQRDEMQHAIVPHLPTNDRDAFERAMNRHFRLWCRDITERFFYYGRKNYSNYSRTGKYGIHF